MNKFQTLIVLTQSFPYDKALEKTFLQDEILQLNSLFSETYIIPKQTKYNRYAEVGNAICVNELDIYITKKIFLFNLSFYLNYFKIIFDEITVNPKSRNILNFTLLIKSTLLASAFLVWFNQFYKKNNFGNKKILIYSFWFDTILSSLSWFKNNNQNITFVTRCHSIDLYEERRENSYIPFRKIALNSLNFIFPDSNRGTNYLINSYPEYDFKIQTLFQGVCESPFTITNSTDGKLRFISCSYVSKRKRVEQIFIFLNTYSLLYPKNKLEWYHIGSGPDFDDLFNLVKSKSETLEVHLLGNLEHNKMLEFYKNNTLDIFLNFSENEGTPVSLMEAASCGFAFIVTDVGGNSDVVTSRNGFTIDPELNKDEFFNILNQLFDNKKLISDFSIESKSIWANKFNLTNNTSHFINTINKNNNNI
jgi:colanic acid/amylovoran biosynthesis glycosyltransferase